MASGYGSLKIVWHPDKLKSLREERVTAPIYVRVKPTNQCNHRCFFCSFAPEVGYILSETFKRNDQIPREKMMEILSDFKDMGVKAVTYSGGGEPLIYPHIEETMAKTLEYGIDLAIITNGQRLDGKRAELLAKAKWVRISLDASNPKTFSESRRVPERLFHELIKNIKNFAQNKDPKCKLGINFVVHKKNSEEIYDSVKFFRELGANNIKFTPVWIENFFEYHEPIKDRVIEQLTRAKKEFGKPGVFDVMDTSKNDFSMTGISNRTYSRCYMMQILPVIAADSAVYFCHDKAYTKVGKIGSVKDRSFKELWFSKEAAEIFKTFNPKKDCKHYCTSDFRNILINDAINGYDEHVNFI